MGKCILTSLPFQPQEVHTSYVPGVTSAKRWNLNIKYSFHLFVGMFIDSFQTEDYTICLIKITHKALHSNICIYFFFIDAVLKSHNDSLKKVHWPRLGIPSP